VRCSPFSAKYFLANFIAASFASVPELQKKALPFSLPNLVTESIFFASAICGSLGYKFDMWKNFLLFFHGFEDCGVQMPKGIHRYSCGEVKIFLAVFVAKFNAFSADKFNGSFGIKRSDEFGILVEEIFHRGNIEKILYLQKGLSRCIKLW